MKIEDVKQLEYRLHEVDGQEWWQIALQVSHEAIASLRAEAWHPIEKVEELGAKDGRGVIVWDGFYWWEATWRQQADNWFLDRGVPLPTCPTHFRFMLPPEGA